MPKTQRSRRNRRRPARGQLAEMRQVVDQLKQLNVVERSQQRSMPPQVADVPKIVLQREKVFTFERSFSGGAITPSATGPTFGSYRFTLDSLPAYIDFTALFDAYRVLQHNVNFFPVIPMSAGSNATLYTVIDYDDDSFPTSVSDLFQYPTLMQSVTGSMIERTFSPRAANAAYSGAFTSYSRMPQSTWVDTSSPSVRYYGLKYAVDAATAVATWAVTQRVVLQFKNIK